LRLHELTVSRALIYDLIPKEHIGKNLMSLIDPPAYMGIAYPGHAHYRYLALAKHGKGKEIASLLREQFSDEIMPSIRENNSISEFWHGGGLIASLCQGHAAYNVIYQTLLGINPTAPGFSKFDIRPAMGMLTHISGSVATPQGRISLSGHRKGSEYRFEIEVPGNIEGKIYVPGTVNETSGAAISHVLNDESILICSPEESKTIIISSQE